MDCRNISLILTMMFWCPNIKLETKTKQNLTISCKIFIYFILTKYLTSSTGFRTETSHLMYIFESFIMNFEFLTPFYKKNLHKKERVPNIEVT